MDESRISRLEKQVDELKGMLTSSENSKKEKKEKKKREPSKFNLFIQEYIKSRKDEENYDHKKTWASAVEAWNAQKNSKP